MLSTKVDALLAFQPPARELLQQKDIHTTAKIYYDFFGFTDNAIVFLKRYITENFNFLSYYDQSSVLLIQTCHNFHAAWPKLHKDPSPLISVLLTQLQNTLALASSISPLDFKIEDEARETFCAKVNAVKDVQSSIDKKFQTLWKQCHMQTTTYYQKLEEYKDQKDKLREEYEQYEKQTRDSKGYNVTLVQELEAKLNEKTMAFIKTKDAFERVCADSQESYNAVLNFFDVNRGLIEEFLKMFMRTLMEMTVFLVERMQQNFIFLKQKTGELHQTVKSLNLTASMEAEENFMKAFCMNPRQQLGQVKEMNRLNYHRQEFVNAMGFFSQESLHICQDAIEKFTYFEEVEIFRDFFSQFDPKIASNLVPFVDFLRELKGLLISLFTHEKTNNEQITQKLASQRLKAYSVLVNTLTRSSKRHSQQPSQINLEQDDSYLDNASVKKNFAEFLKTEENLAQDLVKDIDRLYNAMNQEVWTKVIQSCQKVLVGLKDKLKEEKLTVEVHRIQGSMIQALGHIENIETLETKRTSKKVSNVRDRSTSVPEECAVIAEERLETWSNKINKYNRSEFKFITEKKAESLAEYIKRQNEERLKEINPNPYTVEFEKGKMSVSAYSDEAVLDSFACAFVENMLLQGRMYITSTKIVFKSYFNGRTLFGSTMLFVPLKEIIQVEKKKNSLGIENMIEVTTRKGNLVFTSFVFRDKAFELIQKILNTMHPGYARNFYKGQSVPNYGEALDEEFEENVQIEQAVKGKKGKKINKEQRVQIEFMKRQKELQKVLPPIDKYDQVGYKFQYPVDLNTFFRVMLCKAPLAYKGKNYSCCWEIFEEQQNTSDITVEEWNQELPKDITKKKDLIINNGVFERNCHGTKNLAIPIPFVPKSFKFLQPNKLYLINEKEAICILEVDSKDKIPLSDTFRFRTCYRLKDETGPDGKPMVSMSFNYYVEWFKSTMLKAILLKAAREEITGTGAKLNTVITDLIKDGVFEKKKQELAEANREEESSVEEEEEEESSSGEGIDIEVVNNDAVESTETSETRVVKEDEKVVSETVVSGKQVSEFKVTKRILMIYFSVSLMLCVLIFMRNLYKV